MTTNAIQVYKCLCDKTRLRILHLLQHGPLCVGDLQAVLREPQVKMSKHLAYMRRAGMVDSRRDANRIIYHLPVKPDRLLAENLACLQDLRREMPELKRDLDRLNKATRKFKQTNTKSAKG